MKSNNHPRKEHLVLVGKGVVHDRWNPVHYGTVLGMATTNGILFSAAGFIAMGSALFS
jgi:hypothetical protein